MLARIPVLGESMDLLHTTDSANLETVAITWESWPEPMTDTLAF